MSYYLFPKGDISLLKSLEPIYLLKEEDAIKPKLSPSLSNYLSQLQDERNSTLFQEIQTEIFTYSHGIFREFPEFSPTYFEMIEIIQTMNLNTYIDMLKKSPYSTGTLNIYSFLPDYHIKEHKYLAIHAIQHIQETQINKEMKHHYYLENNYGNSYSSYSITRFEQNYLFFASKLHIILADTTLGYSTMDIIVQMCMILCTQAKKGVLVWKIGETNTECMQDVLFLLSSFYEKMYFIQPFILDNSKSEKYLVCKGFLYDDSYSIYVYLHPFLQKLSNTLSNTPEVSIYRILNQKIPAFFCNKLEEIHYIFGQLQLEQIHYILLLMTHKYRNSKLENIAKLNISKCMDWINKHHYYLSNSVISSPYYSTNNKY